MTRSEHSGGGRNDSAMADGWVEAAAPVTLSHSFIAFAAACNPTAADVSSSLTHHSLLTHCSGNNTTAFQDRGRQEVVEE